MKMRGHWLEYLAGVLGIGASLSIVLGVFVQLAAIPASWVDGLTAWDLIVIGGLLLVAAFGSEAAYKLEE